MSNENQNNKSLNLSVSILIAGVLIAGAVIYAVGAKNQPATAPSGGNQPAPTFDQLMELGSRDVILGDPNAPVTLIEYGDYQCPWCTKFFTETEPSIRENYIKSNKVRMIFRSLAVLDGGRQNGESHLAAAAAECAKDQGKDKFLAYHDALYSAKYQDEQRGGGEGDGFYNRTLFLKLAADVGLDVDTFTSCYDSQKYIQTVDDATVAANAAGITGTPTSLLNGQLILGAQPYSYFSQAIDALLK